MNPYKIKYINYLVNNYFHFEILNDGRIVFDEDNLKIVVNLENGMDIRIFYKMNLTDEEAEVNKQRTIGIINVHTDTEGIWMMHPVVSFDEDFHLDIIEQIEYYIEQIEETAAILLEQNTTHAKGVLQNE